MLLLATDRLRRAEYLKKLEGLQASKEILRLLWEATGQYRVQEGRKRSKYGVSSTFSIMNSLAGVSSVRRVSIKALRYCKKNSRRNAFDVKYSRKYCNPIITYLLKYLFT